MRDESVLVVEDNLMVAHVMQEILADEGYHVAMAADGASATRLLQETHYDVVLLDHALPDVTGQDLLPGWQTEFPDTQIIVITGCADLHLAIDCLKAGAHDFLVKPVDSEKLLGTVSHALAQRESADQGNVSSRQPLLKSAPPEEEMIAVSSASASTLRMARTIAANDFSCVLITGESGTGKGMLARAMHQSGLRADQPLVEVNCSALPPTLVESELFGHRKGTFTDAKEDKMGLFEMADDGTLFLDEIGDMELPLQAKLLKAIEEKRFRPLGSAKDVEVDVTFIAATNQDLAAMVSAGAFRSDLFFRLNVVPLHLSPLRERLEEVPHLIDYFVRLYSHRLGKAVTRLTNEAMAAMMSYHWPGNARELRNFVERGCILTQTPEIDVDSLMLPPNWGSRPAAFSAAAEAAKPGSPAEPFLGPAAPARAAIPLEEAQRRAVYAAMRRAKGNKNAAAKSLGIHRTTLYKKLESFGPVED